jgi:3-oxoacyl-[acyl-carrier-protein] synthase II
MSAPGTSSVRETIAVTGLGAVSAAGSGTDALWESVVRGRSLAAWFRDPRVPDSPAIPACVVPGVNLEGISLRRRQKMDRSVQLAFDAAFQAYTDARLDRRASPPPTLGIVVGTSRGPVQKWSEFLERRQQGQPIAPSLSAHTALACISGALALAFQATGPSFTVSATCASAAHAIAVAAQQILLGAADVMLAGGSDAPLQDGVIRQLLSTGILGSHADPGQACRPFDRNRNGTVLGEGAAFLVLEPLDAARRRGARIHARLAGWAIGADHGHDTAPPEDGAGLVQVMHQALRLANCDPEDLDYINVHGTGTVLNDRCETLAMRRLLGTRGDRVPCSSTKPVAGHCLGASPALEAVISVLALRNQAIPPTANCVELDPECSLDVVAGEARPGRLRVVMSNSLGFWGNNAALIFADTPAAA